jgi:hypothetical protein
MGYLDVSQKDHDLLALAGVSYYDFDGFISVHKSADTGRIVVTARDPYAGVAYDGSIQPFRVYRDGEGEVILYFNPIDS